MREREEIIYRVPTAGSITERGRRISKVSDGVTIQPGRQIDVQFAKNSADLTVSEVLRLARWAGDMRQFEVTDSILVRGLAEPSESKPGKLSERRAMNVWTAMQQFGLHAASLSVYGRVYVANEPRSDSEPGGRRVEVTYVPGCPNDCCAHSH